MKVIFICLSRKGGEETGNLYLGRKREKGELLLVPTAARKSRALAVRGGKRHQSALDLDQKGKGKPYFQKRKKKKKKKRGALLGPISDQKGKKDGREMLAAMKGEKGGKKTAIRRGCTQKRGKGKNGPR